MHVGDAGKLREIFLKAATCASVCVISVMAAIENNKSLLATDLDSL